MPWNQLEAVFCIGCGEHPNLTLTEENGRHDLSRRVGFSHGLVVLIEKSDVHIFVWVVIESVTKFPMQFG